jgi:hypothetical protein
MWLDYRAPISMIGLSISHVHFAVKRASAGASVLRAGAAQLALCHATFPVYIDGDRHKYVFGLNQQPLDINIKKRTHRGQDLLGYIRNQN